MKDASKMQLQDLKERIARSEYDVDSAAVADAVLLRVRLTLLGQQFGELALADSGEVVEAA